MLRTVSLHAVQVVSEALAVLTNLVTPPPSLLSLLPSSAARAGGGGGTGGVPGGAGGGATPARRPDRAPAELAAAAGGGGVGGVGLQAEGGVALSLDEDVGGSGGTVAAVSGPSLGPARVSVPMRTVVQR